MRPANGALAVEPARSEPPPSWRGFALWALAGALAALTVVGAASIGIFVLPFAVAGGWLASRRAPGGRNAFGLVSGVGAIPVLVAWLNRNDGPGGIDTTPWLVTGIALVALGVIAFATRRDHN